MVNGGAIAKLAPARTQQTLRLDRKQQRAQATTCRKALLGQNAIAHSVAQAEPAARQAENIENVQKITALLFEKTIRIRRVLRAIENGVFDQKFKDPELHFCPQYKLMYRIPRGHLETCIVRKWPLMDTVDLKLLRDENDGGVMHKAWYLATRSYAKERVFSSCKKTFDDIGFGRMEHFGFDLAVMLPEFLIPAKIDWAARGVYQLHPVLPEGVQPRTHIFTHISLYGGAKYELPLDDYNVTATWTVTSNWSWYDARLESTRKVKILCRTLFPSQVVEDTVRCDAFQTEPAAQDDGEDDDADDACEGSDDVDENDGSDDKGDPHDDREHDAAPLPTERSSKKRRMSSTTGSAATPDACATQKITKPLVAPPKIAGVPVAPKIKKSELAASEVAAVKQLVA